MSRAKQPTVLLGCGTLQSFQVQIEIQATSHIEPSLYFQSLIKKHERLTVMNKYKLALFQNERIIIEHQADKHYFHP